MKLLLDTSVWVEHLRHAALEPIMGAMRGQFVLHLDAVVAAELRAGCRSQKERRVVAALCAPHERANRLHCPSRSDFESASLALSRLRELGRPLPRSKSALLDALITQIGARIGALVVTKNVADFVPLASEIPARVEAFDTFKRRFLQ